MPYDTLRFACMRGSGHISACDGRYVAYRPFNHVLDKQANPAFQERIERFTRAGHFKHVGTFDEVMVFQLSRNRRGMRRLTKRTPPVSRCGRISSMQRN